MDAFTWDKWILLAAFLLDCFSSKLSGKHFANHTLQMHILISPHCLCTLNPVLRVSRNSRVKHANPCFHTLTRHQIKISRKLVNISLIRTKHTYFCPKMFVFPYLLVSLSTRRKIES